MDAIASSSTSIPPAGSGHDFGSLGSVERAFVSSFLSFGGSLSRSISLAELPGQGRCFVANEDIQDDAELFTIPRAMLLNTRNSQLPKLCQEWEQANGIEATSADGLTNRGDNDMSLDEIKVAAEDDNETTSRSPKVWVELSGWSPLILCMMWEQWRSGNPNASPSSGSSHDWSSYLAIMPNDFSHMPMFWPESDLEHLKGTAVLDRIGRDEADEEYNRNVRPFIRLHAPVFFGQDERVQDAANLDALIDEYYSLKEFHIQGSRILSRSFHVKKEDQADVKEGRAVAAGDADQSREMQEDDEDSDDEDEEEELEQTSDISMVPMADMLNASYASDNSRLFYSPSSLIMRTTRAIKAGEQIFNTYADPPNADLLRRYGYVDRYNGADEVEIMAEALVDAVLAQSSASNAVEDAKQQLMSRIEFLVEQGLEESHIFVYCFAPATTPPHRPQVPSEGSELRSEVEGVMSNGTNFDEELLVTLRTLLLSDEDFERYAKKEKLPKGKWPEDIDEVKRIVQVLLTTFEKRLAGYHGGDSTSQEDEKLIYEASGESSTLTSNQMNAAVVRLGEKRVMEDNTLVLRTWLEMREEKAAKAKAAANGKGNATKRKEANGGSSKTSGQKKARK